MTRYAIGFLTLSTGEWKLFGHSIRDGDDTWLDSCTYETKAQAEQVIECLISATHPEMVVVDFDI